MAGMALPQPPIPQRAEKNALLAPGRDRHNPQIGNARIAEIATAPIRATCRGAGLPQPPIPQRTRRARGARGGLVRTRAKADSRFPSWRRGIDARVRTKPQAVALRGLTCNSAGRVVGRCGRDVSKQKRPRDVSRDLVISGRVDWIRTSDPLTPSQVRYQTAPPPVVRGRTISPFPWRDKYEFGPPLRRRATTEKSGRDATVPGGVGSTGGNV